MSDLFNKVNERITREDNDLLARFARIREDGQPLIKHFFDAKQIIARELENLQFYWKKERAQFSWLERLVYGESRRLPAGYRLEERGNLEDILRTGSGKLELELILRYGYHSFLTLSLHSTGPFTPPQWDLLPKGDSPDNTAVLFFVPIIKHGREYGSCECKKPNN